MDGESTVLRAYTCRVHDEQTGCRLRVLDIVHFLALLFTTFRQLDLLCSSKVRGYRRIPQIVGCFEQNSLFHNFLFSFLKMQILNIIAVILLAIFVVMKLVFAP